MATIKKKTTTTTKKATAKAPTKKSVLVKKATPKKTTASKPKNEGEKFKAHSTSLKVGDKAPVFKGVDQHGKTVSSSELKGKNIILYFYPKDDTPGCTAEACSLRDEYTYLGKQNFVVLGVSADSTKSHKKFADKYDLPFSLLADEDHAIINAFDVWGKKQFMGKIFDGIIRTTFVIDAKGLLKHIITAVDTKNHAQQILGL